MQKLRVLVPLDGSEFSRAVLATLKRVLSPSSHTLTLLRVTALPEVAIPNAQTPKYLGRWDALTSWSYILREADRGANPTHPVYLDEAMREFKADLIDDLGNAKRELEEAGFEVSVAAQFGDPATEITQFAKENFDLIALATHGRSGLNRLVLGSVAESVLRSVTIPVLMVRPVREGAGETLAQRALSPAPIGP